MDVLSDVARSVPGPAMRRDCRGGRHGTTVVVVCRGGRHGMRGAPSGVTSFATGFTCPGGSAVDAPMKSDKNLWIPDVLFQHFDRLRDVGRVCKLDTGQKAKRAYSPVRKSR